MTIFIVLCYQGVKCVKKVRFLEEEHALSFIDKHKELNTFTRMYLSTIEV